MTRMKIPMPSWLINFALGFIDAEASGDVAVYNSRMFEYSFALSKFIKFPAGKLLDVGCISSTNSIIPLACEMGWEVIGVDIRGPHIFNHPNYTFLKGDIRSPSTVLDKNFNIITCISSIEHIGFSGRYGIKKEEPDGPYQALASMRNLLSEQGKLLLTFPYSDVGLKSRLNGVFNRNFVNHIKNYWTVLDERYPHIRENEQVALMELQKK